MKHLLHSALVAAVGLGLAGCLSQTQKNEKALVHAKVDKVFPLGVWYEGGVGGARDNVLPAGPKQAAPVYDRNFADIAAHGVNVVVVPNSPPDHHKPLLDAAAAHGLLVIPELGLDGGPVGAAIRDAKAPDPKLVREQLAKALDPIRSHPALWRVQLLDEPAGGQPIRNYAAVAQVLKSYDPDVKPFCCLAGPGPVREFADAVRPDVTAFDFYPFGAGKAPNDIPSLRDFEAASAAAVGESRKVGADCWAVIQCFAMTGATRYPAPTEVRAMTWLALGTGAKGVFWFLYQTEHVNPAQEMSGLVDRDFSARPDWDEVSHLTKELKPLTRYLLDLKPAGDEKATVIRSKSMYPMTDSKGRKYLLAVNVDPSVPQTLHLSLKTAATKVLRLPDKKVIPSVHNGDTLTWHEEFAPGDGALYVVE